MIPSTVEEDALAEISSRQGLSLSVNFGCKTVCDEKKLRSLISRVGTRTGVVESVATIPFARSSMGSKGCWALSLFLI